MKEAKSCVGLYDGCWYVGLSKKFCWFVKYGWIEGDSCW